MTKDLLVSIECVTYNHENFIADAIESFLMQKTDFAFEILIYDDASTDRTADIIKEYENMYPEIIKPIYQTENQYSKGVYVEMMNLNRVKGKYIATCEGDDYWTDPYKLQKQVEFMEEHPEYSMCVHAANRVSSLKKKVLSSVKPSMQSREMSIDEIIEGGGEFIATNSILYSKEKVLDLPPFYFNAPVGDYPLVIHGALQGKVYYMEDNMSAYRVGVIGSWTEREMTSFEKKKKHLEEINKMLDEINQYTNYQYEQVITRTQKRNLLCLLLQEGRRKEAKKEEFRELYKRLGFKRRMILQIKHLFPVFSQMVVHARWKLIK